MASKIEVYLRSVEDLPFKTYECKGPVHAARKVDYTGERDVENKTEFLIDVAKHKAKLMKANAIIGVEFKDSLIEGTK
jgi:hypothetical protein